MASRFIIEPNDTLKTRLGIEKGGKVQKYIDSQVLRLCDPYVPKDTGALIQSGILHTDIGSGEVAYVTPYARRCYYVPMTFEGRPKRGNYWFSRMKMEGGKEHIASGVKKMTGGKVIVY